ncbi:o-succinylbenzoate--CoA ligase [Pontibacillus salicampi]|uniref:2-succinylbenzoate--CoA ligase n=1 Tax=Pontibacillus salicampi TaxID=1449801 RepID=A0ABV6LNV6_9BACI
MTTHTIPHWLDKRAHLTPDKVAVYFKDQAVTFQQLQRQSFIFAQQLSTIGIQQGHHVAVYAHNSLDLVRLIHALSYIGAVGVFLNTRLTRDEISFQIKDAKCSYILYEQSSQEFLGSIEEEGSLAGYAMSTIHSLEETPFNRVEEINLSHLHSILYTSGTTGNPKGVMLSYGNHWWSAVSSALNLGLSEEDEWLASLPLFHVGGMSILFKSVIYGMPVHLYESFDPEHVHEAIMEKGVTMVSVVSVMLNKLLQLLPPSEGYPQAFRCMLLGGGPAPKPLLEEAHAKNVPVIQTFGMTETASQIVTLSAADALHKLGSAGKPLFPAQIKIEDNNQKQPPNEVGEIVVKGPMVTEGYFERPEANEKSITTDGWLYTGDLGYVDEEGFVYVVDRRKDLIISGGENIYPAEIEGALQGHKDIIEAGVVGKLDERWGQVPVAFIVAEEDYLSIDDIQVYLQDKLAKYKIPKHFYFVKALPRTASNKVKRRVLADWLKKKEES